MSIPPLEHLAQLRLESERRQAFWATTLFLIPGVIWAYVDVELAENPSRLTILHGLRAAQLLVWVVGVLVIRRASRETLRRTLFGIALVIVAFITANSLLRPATNWMPLRVMTLISIGTFVVYHYEFRRQLVAWLALMAAVVGLMTFHWTTMPAYDRVSALVTLLIAGGLGMMIARNRERLDRDLIEALERERAAIEARQRATAALRQLEGIIPICAYCRQVRTEAGAWEELDRYVRSRTDAEFSHGMCPSCAAEHFGDIIEPPSDPRARRERPAV